MGVLYARVAGSWVPIGNGAGNEVFVGPNDPIATDPDIELWYDSDAVVPFTNDAIPAVAGVLRVRSGGGWISVAPGKQLVAVGETKQPSVLSAASAGYREVGYGQPATLGFATTMMVTATCAMAGDSVAVRFSSRLIRNDNGDPGQEENIIEAKSAGLWAQLTLMRVWGVSAGSDPGYKLQTNVQGVITGALYAQSQSMWQRWVG